VRHAGSEKERSREGEAPVLRSSACAHIERERESLTGACRWPLDL
jgi:hypothetical protein